LLAACQENQAASDESVAAGNAGADLKSLVASRNMGLATYVGDDAGS